MQLKVNLFWKRWIFKSFFYRYLVETNLVQLLKNVYQCNWGRTDLSNDHFLMGSVDADDPLTHIQDHGTQHPLPCLEKGKILDEVLFLKAWEEMQLAESVWAGKKFRNSKLTPGGFPANFGTAQLEPFLPQSSNMSEQFWGLFVSRLATVCPRTIRLQSDTHGEKMST